MKTYKILFSKHYDILSVTESDNKMPEDSSHYYDKAKDTHLPDFLLVKAGDVEDARKMGEAFLMKWRNSDDYDAYSNG